MKIHSFSFLKSFQIIQEKILYQKNEIFCCKLKIFKFLSKSLIKNYTIDSLCHNLSCGDYQRPSKPR